MRSLTSCLKAWVSASRVVCSHQISRSLEASASACSMASTGVTPTPADSRTTGTATVGQIEVTAWRRDVDDGAGADVVVQPATDGAVVFAFDADPVLPPAPDNE